MHSRLSRVLVLLCCGIVVMSLSMACGRGRTQSDGNTPTDGGNQLPDTVNPPPDNGNPPPDNGNPPPDNGNPPPRDEPPPPPKTTKCADLFQCAKDKQCGNPADLACLEGCATEKGLEGAGMTLFSAYKTCLSTNCGQCQDAACLGKCIKTNCGLERAKCASDEQSGATNCKLLTACANNCQDEACLGGCFSQSSADAVDTYIKVGICDEKSASGSISAADKKSCYDTALACDCPDKAGQGAGTCADFIKCLSPCGKDTCCVAKCRSQIAQAVVSQADDFTICTVEKCESACQPNDSACLDKCVAEQCGTEYLACQCPGVGPPGMGTQKCGDGLKCIEKCGADDVCCAADCTAKIRASSYSKYLKFIQCLPSCGCQQNDSACFKKCSESGKCSSQALSCAFD